MSMPADWDPMAFVQEGLEGGHQAFGGEGVLHILERCVVIRAPTYEVTLVWRDGEAAWDPDDQVIVFRNFLSDPVVLRHGMVVRVGGRDTYPDNDPNLPAEQWLARPDPSCPGMAFVVHGVTVIRP